MSAKLLYWQGVSVGFSRVDMQGTLLAMPILTQLGLSALSGKTVISLDTGTVLINQPVTAEVSLGFADDWFLGDLGVRCAHCIYKERAMRTRVFKSGNSQAVRIPKELQLPPDVKEVEIEAVPGGVLIRLEGRKLTRLAAKFAALGALGVFAEGRPDQGEEDARAWVSGDGQGAQRRIVLDEILADLPVASFDAAAARAYAQVRQADPQRNRNALDKLIAAHALSLGVVLVTNNVADFQRVPGLTVENWVMG